MSKWYENECVWIRFSNFNVLRTVVRPYLFSTFIDKKCIIVIKRIHFQLAVIPPNLIQFEFNAFYRYVSWMPARIRICQLFLVDIKISIRLEQLSLVVQHLILKSFWLVFAILNFESNLSVSFLSFYFTMLVLSVLIVIIGIIVKFICSRKRRMRLLQDHNIPGPMVHLITGNMRDNNSTPNVLWDSKMIDK